MEEIIKSADNITVKLYRKLSSSKRERHELGKFVLEGMRLVLDALNEGAGLTHLLFTKTAIEKYAEEFSQADLKKVKTLIISNELGNKISLTEKTQGVFAVCNMLEKRNPDGLLETGGKYIVMHKIQDPGNVGMIIRTADALGISGVLLSESCDLFSPKVIRSTMGSVFRVPLWWDMDADDIIFSMKKHYIKTCAAVVDNNALNIKKYNFSSGGAVFIGNEGNGLDYEIVSKCDESVTIKMSGNVNSLNAAMAAGLIMWEMIS